MLRLTLICMVLFVGLYSVLVPAAFAQHEHPAGDPTKLGKVGFPVSCDPNVPPVLCTKESPMKCRFNLVLSLAAALYLSVTLASAHQVQAMKLLTAQVGWVLGGQNLYWTTDDGAHWKDVTPQRSLGESLGGVFFLDASSGWALLNRPDENGEQQFRLASTTDAGATWSSSAIRPPGPRFSEDLRGGGDIVFVDRFHGWVGLGISSSSAFNSAMWLATKDGGRTWKPTPIGAGRAGSLCFFGERDGILAGGSYDTEAWITHDGSRSWQQLALKAPPGTGSADLPTYGEPICEDARRGFLPVTFSRDGSPSALVLFATNDGGHTWTMDRFEANLEERSQGQRVAVAMTGSELILAPGAIAAKTLKLTTIPTRGGSRTAIANVTDSTVVLELSFTSSSAGWASTSNSLLSTTDGGANWKNITPNRMPFGTGSGRRLQKTTQPQPLSEVSIRPTKRGPSRLQPNLETYADVQLGFDTGYVPTTSQMQAWWSYSPYYDYQVNLPGSANHPRNDNLTPAWANTVENQGWGLWPVWVGPQAPCIDLRQTPIVLISATSQSQAYSQGQGQAAAAINALRNLETSGANFAGNIIYYDMENYNTSNSVCVNIVEGFLNGWINGMLSAGYKAGIYGNVAPAALNFSQLSPLPNDVWIALAPLGGTAPSVTIWSLASGQVGLCDPYSLPSCTLWSTDQRIHQYIADGANGIKYIENWGGAPLEIDPDIIDADMAWPSIGTKSYFYNQISFDPEDVPYTLGQNINNIGATLNYGGFINGSASDSSGEIGQVLDYWHTNYNNDFGDLIYYPSTQSVQYLADFYNPTQCNGGYCFTDMQGINNTGWIVGTWKDQGSAFHGFLDTGASSQGGNFTSIDYPGASGTWVIAINDAGLAVGYYQDSNGEHGFIYNAGTGKFVGGPLDYPGSQGVTAPLGINGDAQLVGWYWDGTQAQGFSYSNGDYTPMPGACGASAVPESINNNDQIVGYNNVGYFLSYDLGITCSAYSAGTSAYSINDAGQVSGTVFDPQNGLVSGVVYVPQTP
jgi:hypothetical protein